IGAGAGGGAASSIDDLVRAVDSRTGLRLLVEDRIARQVADAASARANGARNAAVAAIALVGGVLTIVVLLGVSVSRSIARPLRRLTTAAGAVADFAQTELVRVTDEEANQEPGRLAVIDVTSQDEVGDLAAAFNRVQATATLLVEWQIETRRNVSDMFANVARRTQNLVSRQLALIDDLEREERDADLLAKLYRLDHVCTRLRRSANSLFVVSGAREESSGSMPLPLPDVLRTALSEIEDYDRLRLGAVPPATVTAAAASDLVLLFAELMENAVSFSPPTSPVEVWVNEVEDGIEVRIVDHGIGLSEARLAEENQRMSVGQRIDVAPTRMLGLFVVGRLARRHGLDVRLEPTEGRGVTARILLTGTVLAPFARSREPLPPRALPVAAVPGPQTDADRGADVVRIPSSRSMEEPPAAPAAELPMAPIAVRQAAVAGEFPWFGGRSRDTGTDGSRRPAAESPGDRGVVPRTVPRPDFDPQQRPAAAAMNHPTQPAVPPPPAQAPMPPPRQPSMPPPRQPSMAPQPSVAADNGQNPGLARRVRGAQLPAGTNPGQHRAGGPTRQVPVSAPPGEPGRHRDPEAERVAFAQFQNPRARTAPP
ncbi:MAG TPA: sensor histidine kinase, partial [Cryptosporangiaceae bacterium]|nr:sensor histidine kinase [Cryptosporangiaceae bacterium]